MRQQDNTIHILYFLVALALGFIIGLMGYHIYMEPTRVTPTNNSPPQQIQEKRKEPEHLMEIKGDLHTLIL